MPAARRLASWMRPRSSSPVVPMYMVRKPSRAQAAMALATSPPGRTSPSRTDTLHLEWNLAGIGGKAGNHQQRVGGVQSYAGHVELGGHGTIVDGSQGSEEVRSQNRGIGIAGASGYAHRIYHVAS